MLNFGWFFPSKPSSKMKFAAFNPIPTSIVDGSQSEDRNGRQLVIEVGDVGEIPFFQKLQGNLVK